MSQGGRRAGGRFAMVLGLAVAWGAVYGAAAWPALTRPLSAPALIAYGALYTPLPAAQWPRLLSTWLIHVDPLHLLGNLAAWFAAGLRWPDRRCDRVAFRLLALGSCGLGASLASLLWSGDRVAISAGPSGALVGLLVVALGQRGPAPAARAVWLLAALSLLIGGALTGGDTAAHLGGATTALCLIPLYRARPAPAAQ